MCVVIYWSSESLLRPQQPFQKLCQKSRSPSNCLRYCVRTSIRLILSSQKIISKNNVRTFYSKSIIRYITHIIGAREKLLLKHFVCTVSYMYFALCWVHRICANWKITITIKLIFIAILYTTFINFKMSLWHIWYKYRMRVDMQRDVFLLEMKMVAEGSWVEFNSVTQTKGRGRLSVNLVDSRVFHTKFHAWQRDPSKSKKANLRLNSVVCFSISERHVLLNAPVKLSINFTLHCAMKK